MPDFTIESTYRLPVYRQRTYSADTLEQACQQALADEEWAGAKEDRDNAGATHITGIWLGTDTAYQVPEQPVPPHHHDILQRKADHFAAMLDILKRIDNPGGITLRAIAKAEAILVGAADPD